MHGGVRINMMHACAQFNLTTIYYPIPNLPATL
jgi:hypothetical protein